MSNGVPSQPTVVVFASDLVDTRISIRPEGLNDVMVEQSQGSHQTPTASVIAADEMLRRRLARTDYAGPEYATFASNLAAYGLGICGAWLHTGLMFVQCRRHGRDPGPPPTDWSADDRTELALETVAVALRTFRERGLVAGEWTVHGGASLRTYFVGACILAFPNVYRAWVREQRRWGQPVFDDEALLTLPDQAYGPEETVLGALAVQQELSTLDRRTGHVLALRAHGYSQAEIAGIVRTTVRAVEALLYRQRQRSQRQVPEVIGHDHS